MENSVKERPFFLKRCNFILKEWTFFIRCPGSRMKTHQLDLYISLKEARATGSVSQVPRGPREPFPDEDHQRNKDDKYMRKW